MTTSHIATVEVPFEVLAKELGTKRAIEFISEIKECYGDSVVELRKATETLTIEQVEAEVNAMKKQTNNKNSYYDHCDRNRNCWELRRLVIRWSDCFWRELGKPNIVIQRTSN